MDPVENKNGVGADGDPRSAKQTSDDATSSDAQVAAALSHGIVSPRRTVVNTLTPPEHHEEPAAPAPATSTYTPPTTTAQINESFAKTNAETLEKIAENAVKAPVEAPTPSAPTAPAAPAPAPAAPASGPVQASFATPRAAAPTSAPVVPASTEPTAPAPAPVVPAAPAAAPAPAPSQTAPVSAPVQPAAPTPMASMPPRDFPRDHADRGDIILGGGGKPKKKLGLGIIIGLIAIAVLIVVAVVLFFVNRNQGNDQATDGGSFTREETVAAWNNFFNYIYMGTESSSPVTLPQEDTETRFAIEASVPPVGQRLQDYYEKVNSLFTPLSAAFANNFSGSSEDLNSISNDLATLTAISQVQNLNLVAIVELYNQSVQNVGGLDAAYANTAAVVQEVKDAAVSNYASLAGSDNATVQSYYAAIINYVNQVADTFSPVYIRACTNEDGLNVACAANEYLGDNPDFAVATEAAAITEPLITNIKAKASAINAAVNSEDNQEE